MHMSFITEMLYERLLLIYLCVQKSAGVHLCPAPRRFEGSCAKCTNANEPFVYPEMSSFGETLITRLCGVIFGQGVSGCASARLESQEPVEQ